MRNPAAPGLYMRGEASPLAPNLHSGRNARASSVISPSVWLSATPLNGGSAPVTPPPLSAAGRRRRV